MKLSESKIREMDGSESVLITFPDGPLVPFNSHGERCHAKVVDSLPSTGDWRHTGYMSMGYDIYYDKNSIVQRMQFNPYAFCAIKESNLKEESSMVNVTAIVNSILEGKDITKAIMEGAGRLVSARIVKEPYGKGVEVVDSNGAVYRYIVDENDPKYFTAEKVLHAVQAIARRNNYEMDKIYNFLKDHTVDYYDKDVTNRTGLKSAEIVAEPNGEGLKVTLDNGKVFRYTVNTNDPKYDTLEKLKDGAEGMWRHGASIDGVLSFLDSHGMLYAREGKDIRKFRQFVMREGKMLAKRGCKIKSIELF